MANLSLSARDINVLEKIKDPESDPTTGVSIDASLPSDPHIRDDSTYLRVSQREKEIVFSMQQLELQLAGVRPKSNEDPADNYREALSSLDDLIKDHPNYASARNNRAQALRRLYGDSILVSERPPNSQALLQEVGDAERKQAAVTLLTDLDQSVALLSPGPYSPISQQAARTLSMAHTQRAAIYHTTSKLLASATLSVDSSRREAGWKRLEFEGAASRDFAMGGRYGNDIAKGLAVSTNPTAKLCGQIVREAMRKEYGDIFTG